MIYLLNIFILATSNVWKVENDSIEAQSIVPLTCRLQIASIDAMIAFCTSSREWFFFQYFQNFNTFYESVSIRFSRRIFRIYNTKTFIAWSIYLFWVLKPHNLWKQYCLLVFPILALFVFQFLQPNFHPLNNTSECIWLQTDPLCHDWKSFTHEHERLNHAYMQRIISLMKWKLWKLSNFTK